MEHKSIEQVAAYYLDRKAKEGSSTENEVLLSRVHGRPKKLFNNPSTTKPTIDHDTLFRIRTETKSSGQQVIKIATILNSKDDINIEPYFRDAMTEKNNELKDFFQHETVDLFIYEQEDFQYWNLNEQGHLIDKVELQAFVHLQISLLRILTV